MIWIGSSIAGTTSAIIQRRRMLNHARQKDFLKLTDKHEEETRDPRAMVADVGALYYDPDLLEKPESLI